MNAKHMILIAILLLVIIFILQNTQTVEVRLLFWTVTAVRAVVLAITFLAGAAAGFLLRLFWTKRSAEQPRRETGI